MHTEDARRIVLRAAKSPRGGVTAKSGHPMPGDHSNPNGVKPIPSSGSNSSSSSGYGSTNYQVNSSSGFNMSPTRSNRLNGLEQEFQKVRIFGHMLRCWIIILCDYS